MQVALPQGQQSAPDELTITLVSLVVDGAAAFLKDTDAQLSWEGDLERLKPEEAPRSGADLVMSLNRYAQATGRRSWQASFLLGCSLLRDNYVHNRIKIANERACKSLARYLLSLVDSLYDAIGEMAFKVIPAMSGKTNAIKLHLKKLTSQRATSTAHRFVISVSCRLTNAWLKEKVSPQNYLSILIRDGKP